MLKKVKRRKENKIHLYAVYKKTHFRPKDTFRLKVRGWRTIYHANGSRKKVRVAILISENLDFKILYEEMHKGIIS